MFEAGLLRAIISDNLKQARVLAANNFSLLCGEVDGVPPQGFDYGNSPSEFAGLSFKGKSAVLFTTNGTAAINIAAEAPVVIAASLLNRKAAARRAVEEAVRRKLDIAIVCAGRRARHGVQPRRHRRRRRDRRSGLRGRCGDRHDR